MSAQLAKQLEKMEQQFAFLKTYFASAGELTSDERMILVNVETRLGTLRQKVGSTTAVQPGLPPPAPAARAGAGAKADLKLGGASIEKLSLGPPVSGPRTVVLWALLAEDGSGPLNRSNSKIGAQLNEEGRGLLAGFGALKGTLQAWLDLYNKVGRTAERSAGALKKMEEAAGAIGKRSKDRGGAYVRENSEAYIKAQRMVEDKVRAIWALEEALRKAISELNEAGLGQQVKGQQRNVEAAKDAVDAEKKRIEDTRSRLALLFDVAIKVVKQDWASLAEDAVRLVGSQLIDAIPTDRLDELQKQLEKATSDLQRLEDLSLLAEVETASAGLRGAAKALDDARQDVVDAMADLSLAQKTVVEALGESRSTADAAKMIALRGKMLELMEQARQAIERYQRESQPYVAELDRVASMYRSVPSVMKMTPGLDPNGEYGRSLAATALENAETLAVWKSYVVDFQRSGRTALDHLADTGDDGFLVHFNRVARVLQTAIVNR